MKLKIIETEDYVLAVSDKVRVNSTNDWYYEHDNCISLYQFTKETLPREYYLPKVIAYQPKNNAPELDLALLPEMVVEDEANKLAIAYEANNFDGDLGSQPISIFIEGYKAATKVYSEEDLRKAIDIVRKDTYKRESVDEIIQSLKQPKTPKYFVAEREKVYHTNRKGITEFQDSKGFYSWKFKTTTKKNKTYLIGNYE